MKSKSHNYLLQHNLVSKNSHAACYGVLAYQTAWLKTHYTREWMLSNLIWDASNIDQIIIYLGECKRLGIKVLPPNINTSEMSFAFDKDKNIRFGLAPIKNLGEAPVQLILDERKNGPFKSLYDCLNRINISVINKLKVECLIKSGAFDEFGLNRATLLRGLEQYWEWKNSIKAFQKKADTYKKKIIEYHQRLEDIQLNKLSDKGKKLKTFTLPEEPKEPILLEPEIVIELEQEEILKSERELLGFFITAHPLDAYSETLKSEPIYSLQLMKDIINNRNKEDGIYNDLKDYMSFAMVPVKITPFTTKKQKNMAFVDFEDLTGRIDGVVFPKIYEKYKEQIIVGKPIRIYGNIETVEGEEGYTYKLIVNQIEELIIKRKNKEILTLHIDSLNSVQIAQIINRHKGDKYKAKIIFNLQDGNNLIAKELLNTNITNDILKANLK
jgi:DNA polymerase-3 subunit alpha